MKELIQKHLTSGIEEIPLTDFEFLADCGETNSVERKSIREFDDIDKNKAEIKAKLSKAVSAFANYSGGFLLFGVDDNGNIETGVYNKYKGHTLKEWLENVLWTCTTPNIKDFAVKTINKNGKVLLMIVVGESSIAPHQASYETKNKHYKHKYFSRIDGTSQPIDGILVRDIFNRKTFADLEPIVKVEPLENNPVNNLILGIKNNSLVPAEKVVLLATLPRAEGNQKDIINGSGQDASICWNNKEGKITCNTEIVYPDIISYFSGVPLMNTFPNFNCTISIAAKNMLKKDFSINIGNPNPIK